MQAENVTIRYNSPKYPPITYGDYAKLRYRQAHGEDKQLKLPSAT